jgi:hypothetical protein
MNSLCHVFMKMQTSVFHGSVKIVPIYMKRVCLGVFHYVVAHRKFTTEYFAVYYVKFPPVCKGISVKSKLYCVKRTQFMFMWHKGAQHRIATKSVDRKAGYAKTSYINRNET